MMKKLLLFLCLLAALAALPGRAFADTWVGPGQQPTVLQPSTNDVIGDGSDSQGGLAPALTGGSNPQELADIASNFTVSTYLVSPNTRCTSPANGPGAVNCTSAASEAKFRTICNFSHIGHFDPIVFPGQATAGHLHMFFGNTSTNANSDYSQLRQNGESTCAGNKNNRTAYWAPALMEHLASGVDAVRVFDYVVVYYTNNPLSQSAKTTRIPRGFRYIGGYDPVDPNNTKLTTPISTANAAAGWARYSIISGYGVGTSSGTGFEGWSCVAADGSTPYNGSNANSPVAGSSTQPYLRTAAGLPTLTCPTNGYLQATVHAPLCWDGKNIASNDGRHHVAYQVRDNNSGQPVCFDGWYWLTEFIGKFTWSLKGDEDVSKFWLSSDKMNYGAPDASSRSPCRQVSSNYCWGETMHFDWFGAWDYGTAASPGIMIRWMNHCTGTKIVESGTTLAGDPAECDTSTIDSSNGLQISGTTSGGLPFGNPSNILRNAAVTARYRLETGQTGNFVIQHNHTMNDNMPMPANDNETQLANAAPIHFDLRRIGGR